MRLAITFVALFALARPVTGQDRLDGHWRGYWMRAGDSMLVTLEIDRDANTGRYSAAFSAERLRVKGIPFGEVLFDGCCQVTMTLPGDRTTMVFTGNVAGDSLTGSLEETLRGESFGSGTFAYTRIAGFDAPFEEREVTFTNTGVTLAGTLLAPHATGNVPAVVFLHGSGAEERWASRFLAEQLASRGIAALIVDKRGVGGSSGDWRRATLDDLAGDGAAAVAFLHQQRGIDPSRVGLHGHSQGGTLAPFVASRASGVAFIIASAAAGLPTDSTEVFSILNAVYPRAVSAADSTQAEAYVSELVAVAYHGRPRDRLDSLVAALRDRPWFFAPPAADNAYWFFSPLFAQYDAPEWWSRVRVPVLLVYGGDDQRVPARQSAERIATALRSAGNTDITVRIYEGADHTFRLPSGASGWPVTVPGYLGDLLDWLAKR